MLALSPLKDSKADDQRRDEAGGFCFSDNLLEGEVDFLHNIDFSGIFDCLPELHLSGSDSAGGEEQPNVAPQVDQQKDVILTAPSPVSSGSRRPEGKSSHRKKKVKVDWTPELHRRFVTAVEQLGVDKAVPSRILEIMGINNLTRHNVASHLQKYRSHWKHMVAREAEAGRWSCREKEKSSSCVGFPHPPMLPPFRSLHVWGHPTVDCRRPLLRAMWPGNGIPFQFPAAQWRPQPPNYIAYWQPHYQLASREEGWGPPCLPHPLPTIVTGVPPHTMLHWVPPLEQKQGLQPELSAYPSKKSIDAAIEEVIEKPWLPLPLGLKPPSTESVLFELQKQGVSAVPPSSVCVS